MTLSFEGLHDATLVNIDFTWTTGMIDVYLRTSANPNFKLTITGVKSVSGTRIFDWGPSEQVNSITFSNETLVIEIQSGDIIRINGTSVF